MLEEKFELEDKELTLLVLTLQSFEGLYMQPEKLNEGKCISIKYLWWKAWKCPRGSDARKYIQIKEVSKIFHNIESAKGKMLEATWNLKRNTTTCHNIEKNLTLYCKLHDEKGSALQRT